MILDGTFRAKGVKKNVVHRRGLSSKDEVNYGRTRLGSPVGRVLGIFG
jgi:hypothetical protein